MDFIEQLPASGGFTAILVVIDRLSKQAVFIPCDDNVNSERLARMFLQHVFSKHGVPQHISSDRGAEFTSRFFRSLAEALDIKIHYTSGHHPEANGQVERVNQTLEQYLRLYCAYHQDDWAELLPIAEFSYNNTPSESTGVSPFFATKGFHPDMTVHPERDLASVRARDFTVDIDELHVMLREQIRHAQAKYSEQANNRRTPPPDFAVGSQVYVSTEHLRLSRPTRKLAERFIGPVTIIGRAGSQSFQVKLPAELKSVHPVFHVSQLEPFIPDAFPGRVQPPPPPDKVDDHDEFTVKKVLDSRVNKRFKRIPSLSYYVQWEGYEGTEEEFTWEPSNHLSNSAEFIEDFHAAHPDRPGSYELFLDECKRFALPPE